MTDPVVSVIMPAYNSAALIGETLDSLAAQTFTDFEIIVAEDRSPDDTMAVLAAWPDPRLRIFQMDTNGGPVLARNRAVAQARGRYIAALDHDDLCHPDRLARQVAWLDAHPATVLVATATRTFSGTETFPASNPRRTTPAMIRFLLAIGNPLVWSSVMMRGTAARQLAPFSRQERVYAEDFDLYHRIGELGAIERIDDPLVRYRRHPGNVSERFEDTMLAHAAMVLADAHRARLGDDGATMVAGLLVQHLMHGRPVPDGATLVTLGQALAAIERAVASGLAASAHDRAMIAAERQRRWSAVVRAGLRSGNVTLGDVRRAAASRLDRPERLWSRLVGAARQTLAA